MQCTIEKTKRALCCNPQRSSLFVGFIGLAIILCGRTLLNGPASTPASTILQPMPPITGLLKERVQPSSALLDWLAQPKRTMARNLFASNLDSYASAGEHENPAETKERPGQLDLQTTIMEAPRRAMVNGQLVNEGDTIDGYTVVKIQPRKIFVRQGGRILEIEMR
jgi:hypothetical protein